MSGLEFDGWRLRGVWVVRFRIYISKVKKEFAEERRLLVADVFAAKHSVPKGLVGSQSRRSRHGRNV